MGIKLNLDGVEPQQGGGLGPLPDGEYVVQVTSVKEVKASTGTPGFEFELEVLVGDYEGRKIWDRLWFTPRTAGQVRWKMECAGVPIPAGDFVVEPDHFQRKRVMVVVRQEEYTAKDGSRKTRAEVKGWNPPPNRGGGESDPFALYAGDPGPGERPPHSDDEIPF